MATVSSIAGAHLPRAPTTKLNHDVVAVKIVSHMVTVSSTAGAHLPKARPETRDRPSFLPRFGRWKNCLKYGENVLNCRGPPTQSPNHKTWLRCRCCHNCLTYYDSVLNCRGLPSKNLKSTSTIPANTSALPKGTTTENPTPLAPISLKYQVKTTLTNNEPIYTNPDRALKIFAKRNRRQAHYDDLNVVPIETPSVLTSGPPVPCTTELLSQHLTPYTLLTLPLISTCHVTGMEQWGRCPPISYPPPWTK